MFARSTVRWVFCLGIAGLAAACGAGRSTPGEDPETKSTASMVTWTDGKEYPLVKVEVSSASHPFYTGKQKIVDTAGRVDRFRRKYGL